MLIVVLFPIDVAIVVKMYNINSDMCPMNLNVMNEVNRDVSAWQPRGDEKLAGVAYKDAQIGRHLAANCGADKCNCETVSF